VRHAYALLILTLLTVPIATANAGYLPDGTPYQSDYPSTKITGYYTAYCQDFTRPNGDLKWCHEPGDCITTVEELKQEYPGETECIEKSRWCCIPENERGFYEAIQCQGSGVCDGNLYNYESISTTPKQGILETGERYGYTASGEPARPEKTVAVIRPQDDANCGIPYGTRLYIDLGPQNQWTGEYTAQDTGSAFREGTRDGQCKIDVFTGSGAEAKQVANEITRDNVDVYILEWGDDETTPNFNADRDRNTPAQTTGYTAAQYSYMTLLPEVAKIWNTAQNTKEELESCDASSTECIQDVLEDQTTEDISVSQSCNVQPLNTEPPLQQELVTRGTVVSASDIRSQDGAVTRTITLETSAGETQFTLESTDAENLRVTEGREAVLFSYFNQQPTFSGGTAIYLDSFNVDRDATFRSQTTPAESELWDVLLGLAACETSETPCVCETNSSREIYFGGSTASIGNFQVGNTEPYNFDALNATTQTQYFEAPTQQVLEQTLRATLQNQGVERRRFTVPTEEQYYLVADSKVGLLREKPEWYNDPNDEESRAEQARRLIETYRDIQDPTRLAELVEEEPLIDQCEPRHVYQPVCVQHNTYNHPPLEFTVKI
jgi:3D (Asp-Asp-Asp) domain-containing protein